MLEKEIKQRSSSATRFSFLGAASAEAVVEAVVSFYDSLSLWKWMSQILLAVRRTLLESLLHAME